MRSAILIAVRMKSQRLPKKALLKIDGEPLIVHLIKRMKLARIPDCIVVCTSRNLEDRVLIEIAKRNFVHWFAGDEYDVLNRFIEAAEAVDADIVVRVTGDNPLTDHIYVDKLIRYHIENEAEYTCVEGLPEGTKPEVISYEALKKCHELAANPEYSEYMTLYFKYSGMFKVATLMAEQEVARPHYRLSVDTPEDLTLIRELYKRLGENIFDLREIIKLLDKNPELVEINRHVKQKKVGLIFVDGKIKLVEEE